MKWIQIGNRNVKIYKITKLKIESQNNLLQSTDDNKTTVLDKDKSKELKINKVPIFLLKIIRINKCT